MKPAVIPLSVAFALVGTVAFAQTVSDPLASLRACSLMENTERLDCLDKLSRSLAPPQAPSTPAANNWVISETSSPLDYAPIVVANTLSREGRENSAMQLSVSCRAGRTELVVAGPGISGKTEDYHVSYRIDGNEPVQILAGEPSFGAGAAFKVDVVRLFQSFPEHGAIVVRLALRNGAIREGSFSLDGLKAVRDKLAAACKWPQEIANPSKLTSKLGIVRENR
jgi:hypothetical protein